MDLKKAAELIWENRRYKAASETEALSHLNEEVAESLKAILCGKRDIAQAELEDAFSCLLIAFKTMDINPEEAVLRQIAKMKEPAKRIMHIFPDRVEIRVDNEVRGGWAIWSVDDLKEAEKMAREFNCELVKEDRSNQLTLDLSSPNLN